MIKLQKKFSREHLKLLEGNWILDNLVILSELGVGNSSVYLVENGEN
jgi:hypothetical protein